MVFKEERMHHASNEVDMCSLPQRSLASVIGTGMTVKFLCAMNTI